MDLSRNVIVPPLAWLESRTPRFDGNSHFCDHAYQTAIPFQHVQSTVILVNSRVISTHLVPGKDRTKHHVSTTKFSFLVKL